MLEFQFNFSKNHYNLSLMYFLNRFPFFLLNSLGLFFIFFFGNLKGCRISLAEVS